MSRSNQQHLIEDTYGGKELNRWKRLQVSVEQAFHLTEKKIGSYFELLEFISQKKKKDLSAS